MILNGYCTGSAAINGISLVSCGHIFAKEGRQISRPGGREDWLLFYVAKGQEAFCLDNREIADAGCFILFRPFEKQEHVCISDSAEFYYAHFSVSGDSHISALETSVIYKTVPSATVCALFEDMIQEVQFKKTNYDTVCICKLLEILAKLERKVLDAGKPHREHFDKIAQSVTLLHKEYMAGHTLEHYAALCCMSKYHYLRVFKSVIGFSPIEYRNRIRIEHAKELLEDTGLSIAQIGERTGFSSPSSFCDAFKKQTGMSPAAFRKNSKSTSIP